MLSGKHQIKSYDNENASDMTDFETESFCSKSVKCDKEKHHFISNI